MFLRRPQRFFPTLKGVMDRRRGSLLSGRPWEGTSKVSSISKDSRRPRFPDSNIHKAGSSAHQSDGSAHQSLTLHPHSYTACRTLINLAPPLSPNPPLPSLSLLPPATPASSLLPDTRSLFLPQGHGPSCPPSARTAPWLLPTLPTANASHSSGLGSNATSSHRPSMASSVILHPCSLGECANGSQLLRFKSQPC